MPPAELTTKPARSIPEYIVLDSDDDNRTPLVHSTSTDSICFVDRLSASGSQPRADYHDEDSKYSQLPSHSKSTPAVIRPIISKNQRRKQKNNISSSTSTPLVSAIDRIIDHMDQSDSLNAANLAEQRILYEKSLKKRKKKKKKQPVNE